MQSTSIDKVFATGLDQREVLAELYNNSKPLGMGIYHYEATPMTVEDAEKMLQQTKYFDYVKGRCMKIDFSKYPEISSSSYDRQYGAGSVQKCLDNVRNANLTKTVPREPATEKELKETIDKCKITLTASDRKIDDKIDGKTVASLKLNKFDKVWFVHSFVEELEDANIPYPSDWHMFMGIENDQATFVGSMGGRYAVSVNAPIIRVHDSEL